MNMKQLYTVLFFFILISSYSQVNLFTGLKSYWTLDGTLNDSYGGNNWVDYGSNDCQDGILNHCRQFNQSTSGQYAEASSISLSTEATLSFWFYSFGSQNMDAAVVIKVHGGSLDDQSVFGVQTATQNTMWLNASANEYNSLFTSQTVSYTHNQWHHIVWIFDGPNHRTILYFDGVKTTADCSFSTIYNPVTKMKMGMQKFESRSFAGRIDEVGVWNRVLTDAEAAVLYNNGNGNQLANHGSLIIHSHGKVTVNGNLITVP
jgi:hypothetical protein